MFDSLGTEKIKQIIVTAWSLWTGKKYDKIYKM